MRRECITEEKKICDSREGRKIGSRTIVLVRKFFFLRWWWELAWIYLDCCVFFAALRCIGNRHNGMGWWWVLYVGLEIFFTSNVRVDRRRFVRFFSFCLRWWCMNSWMMSLNPARRQSSVRLFFLIAQPKTRHWLFFAVPYTIKMLIHSRGWNWGRRIHIQTKSAYRNFFLSFLRVSQIKISNFFAILFSWRLTCSFDSA